jgi:hypothetical protein
MLSLELGLVGFSYEVWYRIDLTLDDQPLANLPLRIVQDPALRDRMMFSERQTTPEPPPT